MPLNNSKPKITASYFKEEAGQAGRLVNFNHIFNNSPGEGQSNNDWKQSGAFTNANRTKEELRKFIQKNNLWPNPGVMQTDKQMKPKVDEILTKYTKKGAPGQSLKADGRETAEKNIRNVLHLYNEWHRINKNDRGPIHNYVMRQETRRARPSIRKSLSSTQKSLQTRLVAVNTEIALLEQQYNVVHHKLQDARKRRTFLHNKLETKEASNSTRKKSNRTTKQHSNAFRNFREKQRLRRTGTTLLNADMATAFEYALSPSENTNTTTTNNNNTSTINNSSATMPKSPMSSRSNRSTE